MIPFAKAVVFSGFINQLPKNSGAQACILYTINTFCLLIHHFISIHSSGLHPIHPHVFQHIHDVSCWSTTFSGQLGPSLVGSWFQFVHKLHWQNSFRYPIVKPWLTLINHCEPIMNLCQRLPLGKRCSYATADRQFHLWTAAQVLRTAGAAPRHVRKPGAVAGLLRLSVALVEHHRRKIIGKSWGKKQLLYIDSSMGFLWFSVHLHPISFFWGRSQHPGA